MNGRTRTRVRGEHRRGGELRLLRQHASLVFRVRKVQGSAPVRAPTILNAILRLSVRSVPRMPWQWLLLDGDAEAEVLFRLFYL